MTFLQSENYIIGLSGKQPRRNFVKIVAVRFAFCYNTDKPCFAGWAGFNITLLHYPLFAYFPHTQDSQQSICLEKGDRPLFTKKGDSPIKRGLSPFFVLYWRCGF